MKETYWDKATWDVAPPKLPGTDKWYYSVLWACLFLGVTLYLNWAQKSGVL